MMSSAAARVLVTVLGLLASAAWSSAPVQEEPPSDISPASLRQSIQIVQFPGRYVSFRYVLTGPDGARYNHPSGRESLGSPAFALYKGNKIAASGWFGFG